MGPKKNLPDLFVVEKHLVDLPPPFSTTHWLRPFFFFASKTPNQIGPNFPTFRVNGARHVHIGSGWFETRCTGTKGPHHLGEIEPGGKPRIQGNPNTACPTHESLDTNRYLWRSNGNGWDNVPVSVLPVTLKWRGFECGSGHSQPSNAIKSSTCNCSLKTERFRGNSENYKIRLIRVVWRGISPISTN